MKIIQVQYRVTLPNGHNETFKTKIDSYSLKLISRPPKNPPFWTELGFKQCPHCPLSIQSCSHCPMATSLLNVVETCNNIVSYDKVTVEVTTKERVVSKKTSAQKAISSLMGLITATCDCPHMFFFRPMARFHLPFASEEETIYRATSSYLLSQFFREKKGCKFDMDMKGLQEIYKNVHKINVAMSARLRASAGEDSSLNALVLLDCLATLLPSSIGHSLSEMEPLFMPFIKNLPQD